VAPQHTPSTSVVQQWQQLLTPMQPICKQQRSWQRLQLLNCGLLSTLGRHTLSQVITTLGAGDDDWSSWYRLFTQQRVKWGHAQQQLVRAVNQECAAKAPFVVGLDATHLPRTSERMPAVRLVPHPRTPAWRRGLHLAQRWVGLSALLPRSADGDSRAVPLRMVPACSEKGQPIDGYDPMSEWEAGTEQLGWLRQRLDEQGQQERQIVAVADGAYSSAGLWRSLPERTVLVARCAKNRALFALPTEQPERGRKRCYGERLPTPEQERQQGRGFRPVSIRVRGRTVTPRVKVVGPVLVRSAPDCPLFLLVIAGYRPTGGSRQRRRQPTQLLVNAAQQPDGTWVLPMPVEELLAWAWQRWELEVMHRELKSGFGLGQQQQWSDAGVLGVVHWLTWLYATLILAGYRTWGYDPPGRATLGGWWKPRRWSLATLWQAIRMDVWQLAAFLPVWGRSTDKWGEMSAWVTDPETVVASYRRF
jgi:hypothetical protein